MLERIILVCVAAMPRARDDAGMMIDLKKGMNPSAIDVVALILGSQFSFSEKTMRSMRPNQNFGRETPTVASAVAAESQKLLCLRAARIPSGREMHKASMIEHAASLHVAGRRSVMLSKTPFPVA